MAVLERTYKLPCKKPFIEVGVIFCWSSRQPHAGWDSSKMFYFPLISFLSPFFFQENTHRRLVKVKRFRHVEQKGFQTFFENWKEKVLNKGTASDDKIQDGFIDDEESKFSHL